MSDKNHFYDDALSVLLTVRSEGGKEAAELKAVDETLKEARSCRLYLLGKREKLTREITALDSQISNIQSLHTSLIGMDRRVRIG